MRFLPLKITFVVFSFVITTLYKLSALTLVNQRNRNRVMGNKITRAEV